MMRPESSAPREMDLAVVNMLVDRESRIVFRCDLHISAALVFTAGQQGYHTAWMMVK
jgi:hypothetical protein